MAKITAIYRVVVLDWHRTRDHFPSQMIAMYYNHNSPKEAKVLTAQDFLEYRYPAEKPSVIITHNPDHGAQGDWRGLRDALRGRGKRANG